MAKLTATLYIFNSKADRAGNRYFAFRFVDHETGHNVEGACGNCENVRHVYRYYSKPGDEVDSCGFNRSIQHTGHEMGIRDFDQMTKGWAHVSSQPEQIAQFIKTKLGEQG